MQRWSMVTLAILLNCLLLNVPLRAQMTIYNFGGDELNLLTPLNSNSSKVGDTVRALVSHSFTANGRFLPKGSIVSGSVLYVQASQPRKTHKKEVIPEQSARIGFDLDQAKLPDGSVIRALDIHLQRLSYPTPPNPFGVAAIPGVTENAGTLSQAEYEGMKVNQVDFARPILIPEGAKLTVSEEWKLRPAVARYGTVEALDLVPGTDLGPALAPFIRSMSAAWKELAGKVQSSLPMPSMTVLEFDLDAAGNVWNLQMVRSAGLREYDLTAVRALVRVRQGPHIANLPESKKLPLRMSFMYGAQTFVPPESHTGPPVPVPVEQIFQPAMLADSAIVSVLLDHDGAVRDALAVDPKDPALAGQAVTAAKAMHFTPFGQSVGAPLKHSVLVIPLIQLASQSSP